MFARLRHVRLYARAPHFRTACGVPVSTYGRRPCNIELLTTRCRPPHPQRRRRCQRSPPAAVVATSSDRNVHARLSAAHAHYVRRLCATHRCCGSAGRLLSPPSRFYPVGHELENGILCECERRRPELSTILGQCRFWRGGTALMSWWWSCRHQRRRGPVRMKWSTFPDCTHTQCCIKPHAIDRINNISFRAQRQFVTRD